MQWHCAVRLFVAIPFCHANSIKIGPAAECAQRALQTERERFATRTIAWL